MRIIISIIISGQVVYKNVYNEVKRRIEEREEENFGWQFCEWRRHDKLFSPLLHIDLSLSLAWPGPASTYLACFPRNWFPFRLTEEDTSILSQLTALGKINSKRNYKITDKINEIEGNLILNLNC